jgi:hypothetical protein
MISVWVYIDDFSLDDKMDSIAVKYGGHNTGSGFGFGFRDISYDFEDEELAHKFISHAARLKKVHNVKILD